MKQNISVYQFRDAFSEMGRNDNFSYEGLEVLFYALEDYADESGIEIELDVIALCCEFSEYPVSEIADIYPDVDLTDCVCPDDEQIAVLDYLHENTMVCGIAETGELGTTVIFMQF